jgi:hypothetical protein
VIRYRALVRLGVGIVAIACGDRAPDGATDTFGAGGPPVATTVVDRCYRSTHSVLLGAPTSYGQRREGPGWIRLSGAVDADSGAAVLVDADGSGLDGVWRHQAGDSVDVTAFDDFLRVELRLRVDQARSSGRGRAHSDAALERDSSGRLTELRRAWAVLANAASCDSMPPRAAAGPSPN